MKCSRCGRDENEIVASCVNSFNANGDISVDVLFLSLHGELICSRCCSEDIISLKGLRPVVQYHTGSGKFSKDLVKMMKIKEIKEK